MSQSASFFLCLSNLCEKLSFIYLCECLLDCFAVGLAAWLAVIPIIAWHFYQLQLLTALWTVPASVPATIIIILGTFKILLNPLLPTLAARFGIHNRFLSKNPFVSCYNLRQSPAFQYNRRQTGNLYCFAFLSADFPVEIFPISQKTCFKFYLSGSNSIFVLSPSFL